MEPFTFFISYRRADTAPIALLLKNEIEKRLQFVRAFVDVEDLKPGEPFPERLRQAIDGAGATLVLIGSRWMPAKGDGMPSEGTDYVAIEVERSLATPVVAGAAGSGSPRTVIPVFIDIDRSFSRFELPPAIEAVSVLHAERLEFASWPKLIGPFIDSLADRLGLSKRPSLDERPRPDPAKARTQPVSDEELLTILKYDDYQGWYLDNFGNANVLCLVKKFEFSNFEQADDFMRLVANHCKVLDHHPEWQNLHRYVTVSLTTLDAGSRVTIYDLNLALFMNKTAEAVLEGRC